MFLSQFGLIFLGLGIKFIQTGELGDFRFGEYALFVSITSMALIIFRFGFFTSLQVLLANSKDQNEERELIGMGIIVTLLIALLFAVSMFILSKFINDWFQTNLGPTLASASLFCMLFPFQNLIGAISTGTNKIKQGALFNLLPKALFLLILLIYIQSNELSVLSTIYMNLSASLVMLIPILWSFKPGFRNFKKSGSLLWSKNKSYGIHYYLGSLFNQTTYRMDELFLAYFHSSILVGYYSLTNLICTPMVLMSHSLSKAMFKRFAQGDRIPPKVFVYNFYWLIICIAGLSSLVFLFTNVEYSEYNFNEVLKYLLPLSIAFFFQGLCSPYAFLAAKSLGKEIRNVAWAEAVLNIIGNLVLIKEFGIMGAIYSSIAAKAVHFLALRYYYRKYLIDNNIA